ncbi:MAG TPA: 2-polyprenyl-3-methyl-6-methoxy-1,4-benzoquinone monooxygenase [Gammaproteobacteria bacterium]|nr:2-polyprenyl-3-methyl-6-methoxy-1,4-benzoquinone monooxygenase [Gammaproteobacteria bacterium]
MQTPSSWPDRFIAVIDETLRAFAVPPRTSRPSPAAEHEEPRLSLAEKRRAAALMRVNHAGEIAAQALYIGQSVAARSSAVRERLLEAAREERDHLAWCGERIEELGGRRSVLDPFWFAGSLCIGAVAGLLGDRQSLGFVAETERQVEAHLADHLRRLPSADAKSAALLRHMAEDEARHGRNAELAGGAQLPQPVRTAMRFGGGFLRRAALFL